MMTTNTLEVDALVIELLPELLPTVVINISELIGYRAALKLVQAMGGFEFDMPSSARSGRYQDMLTNAVGAEAALTLMEHYSGEQMYIPRCHSAFTQLRNQEFRNEITKAVRDGEKQQFAIHRLAPEYGFTERWAYSVLSGENKSRDNQLNLFD